MNAGLHTRSFISNVVCKGRIRSVIVCISVILLRVLQSWLGLLRPVAMPTWTSVSETCCMWSAYEQVYAMLLKSKQGILQYTMSVHMVGACLQHPAEEFACCYSSGALPPFCSEALVACWEVSAMICSEFRSKSTMMEEGETGLKWFVCCVRFDGCAFWQVPSVSIC